MTKTTLKLIAAACENMGIGVNGTLPWRLKKELNYFSTMTTKVEEEGKMNAVIMGRKTWDSVPPKYRPFSNRLNIVLTRNADELKKQVPAGVAVVASLDDAIRLVEERDDIESTWVIGGSAVYKAAMDHPNCGAIYLTEIQKSFDCDTFFPSLGPGFESVRDERVPGGEQVEGDVRYHFRVYRKL